MLYINRKLLENMGWTETTVLDGPERWDLTVVGRNFTLVRASKPEDRPPVVWAFSCETQGFNHVSTLDELLYYALEVGKDLGYEKRKQETREFLVGRYPTEE